MQTPYERMKAAWGATDRPAALNRVVETMAAEGVTLSELDDGLGRLLDEIRAAGADDDTEEIINCVGDRLHGWCHASWHIKTAEPPAGANGHTAPRATTATSASCTECGEKLVQEPVGSPRFPCPACGSMRRTFALGCGGSLAPSGHMMGVVTRDNQPRGFVEGERPELTRHATITPDGNIRLNLRGLAPRNEQDSDTACGTLVSALSARGIPAELLGRGEKDADCVIRVGEMRVGVQVVRALTDPEFWKRLAHNGTVTDLVLTIAECVSALRVAIEHKTKIPVEQRNELVLLLDAFRLPALALGPVVDEFRKEHLHWARGLGFDAIYVAGPLPVFVSRLDA